MRIISEPEFRREVAQTLTAATAFAPDIGAVTGPGRSGAVAAVYASHMLGVPFIPYGSKAPTHLGRLLIIDTASESGKTLRKAVKKYEAMGHTPTTLFVYDETDPAVGRVAFWYEAIKPQRYKHERDPKHARGHSDKHDK